jgi:hypothetical protein
MHEFGASPINVRTCRIPGFLAAPRVQVNAEMVAFRQDQRLHAASGRSESSDHLPAGALQPLVVTTPRR